MQHLWDSGDLKRAVCGWGYGVGESMDTGIEALEKDLRRTPENDWLVSTYTSKRFPLPMQNTSRLQGVDRTLEEGDVDRGIQRVGSSLALLPLHFHRKRQWPGIEDHPPGGLRRWTWEPIYPLLHRIELPN